MKPCDIFSFQKPREIIGIAGFIGAGKSVVSRILRCNGFCVYDCDYEAAVLMNTNKNLRDALYEIIGEMCYDSNGKLNKKHVAEKIFSDTEIRNRVNQAVHSSVKRDFLRFANTRYGKVFIESAILTTSGLDRVCDEIWLVDAPEALRVHRVMTRNSLSEKEVRDRMEVQKNELTFLPKDKIVIIENHDNSQTLEKVVSLAFGETTSSRFEFFLQTC